MNTRVFLVQGVDNILTLLTELFSAVAGLEIVGAASTQAEAQLWMESNFGAWDLVVVDLSPDEEGALAVIAACKSTAPDGKVAVFSRYGSPGVIQRCMALGADAFFYKSEMAGFIRWVGELQRGD